MISMKRLFAPLLILVLFSSSSRAQLEPIPEERGAAGLALALRKLSAGATFMHTAAHPDDEDNTASMAQSSTSPGLTSLATPSVSRRP